MGETGRAAVIIDNKVVSCDSDNIGDTDPGADTFITECHHSPSASVHMEDSGAESMN